MKQVRSEALYCSDYFREIMRTLLSRDQAVARSPKGDAFSDWAGLATQQQFFFSFLAAASLHPNLAASIIHASTVAALHHQQQHHKQHTSAHMCRHTAPNFFPGIGRGGRREGERDRERERQRETERERERERERESFTSTDISIPLISSSLST